MKNKVVEFVRSGRGKAQCDPDPNYPNGKAIPAPIGSVVNCKVQLPYPAPECGLWRVHCTTCDSTVLITAAGRIDDPVSFFMPCQSVGAAQ